MQPIPVELKCFPLPAGKKGPPLAARFYEIAVPASELERAGNNVGVSTTGWLVVDIDAQKDGFDSLAVLEMANDQLPVTYTVKTPRGGEHRYFRPPHTVANSREKLGKGIDVRGHHGYVVGAGSITVDTDESAAGEYVVTVNAPIAEAPQWLVDLCERPRERDAAALSDIAELDTPQAVDRARAYLVDADPAIQGAGGDERTYKTAATVLDFGLSREMAAEVMQPWNERCQPPWDPDDLQRKIDNAWSYRLNGVGSSDPKAEFDEWRAPPSGAFQPTPFTAADIRLLPPRPWILDKFLLRRCVTAFAAPGGTGKTMLMIEAAISVAANRELLGVPVIEPTSAWFFCNEDDLEELHRRTIAVMRELDIKPEDVGDRLFIDSGEKKRLKITRNDSNGRLVVHHENVAAIKESILAHKIGLFIVDPLISIHTGKENDNDDAEFVIDILRQIAQDTNCAVGVPAHTRKAAGSARERGDVTADSMRGAGSLKDATRVTALLARATPEEVKHYGWPEREARRYIKLWVDKENMSLTEDAQWFRFESLKMETTDPDRPEWVGVPRHFVPVTVREAESEFDRLVLEICGEEGCSRSHLVTALAEHPMFAEKSRDTIRKRIDREAETAGSWSLSSNSSGTPGSVWVAPIKSSKTINTPVSQASGRSGQEAGANPSGRSGQEADSPLENV